ncbi:MAG: InlB B-repeat-containing protein [Clostridiales bacterium]|nr:InlB B-repeat-containing protein [Clostridiales bacterium]
MRVLKKYKRFLSILLAVCLLVGMSQSAAYALEETGSAEAASEEADEGEAEADENEAENGEASALEDEEEAEEESESDPDGGIKGSAMILGSAAVSLCSHGNDADSCAVCEVEDLIDALPSVDEIAAVDTDEQNEVYAQASDICDAYYELTGDEQEQVSNIDDLWDVLDYFSGEIATTADSTGDFTVTGGTYGTDYTYSSGKLIILTSTELTISTTQQTSNHIVVGPGVEANIVLAGVNIVTSGNDSTNWTSCPIYMGAAGESTITLAAGTENILDASSTTDQGPGIYVPATYQLTIKGDGSLTAKGGRYWPGIGRSGGNGNILIESGTITAVGGASAAGIGGSNWYLGGTIKITGGYITATAGSDASDIGNGKPGGSAGSLSVTITGGYFADGDASANTVYSKSVADGYGVYYNNDEDTKADYPYVVLKNGVTYSVTLVVEAGSEITQNNVTEYLSGTGATLPTGDDVSCDEGKALNGRYTDAAFTDGPYVEIGSSEYGDKTYYAKIGNPIAVTLDCNGGTCSTYSVTVVFGKTFESLPTPTREGYTFVGWYTGNEDGTLVTETTVVEKDSYTLYAHWYDANGFCEQCGQYQPASYNETAQCYEIGNAGQLFWFAALVNGDDSNAEFTDEDLARGTYDAVLTADIDLNPGYTFDTDGSYTVGSGTLHEWTPIGVYTYSSDWAVYEDNFDGQGHSISGIYINTDDGYYQGLFGCLDEASVSNVTVTNSYISGKTSGGIAGYAYGSEISGCENNGTVKASTDYDDAYAGGIVGYAYCSTISGCENNGVVIVTDGNYAGSGGITGYAEDSSLSGNTNSGTISASGTYTACAGGIVGLGYEYEVSGDENTGEISAEATYYAYAGGITSYGGYDVENSDCDNSGAISADSEEACGYAGGIAGSVEEGTVVSGCTNSGAVSSSGYGGAFSGGIAGCIVYYSEIAESSNSGSVTAEAEASTAYAGGITSCADDYSSISASNNSGDVKADGEYGACAGGIVGCTLTSGAEECENDGTVYAVTVNGDAYAGGIVGNADYNSEFNNCANRASVTADSGETEAAAGGIAGFMYSSTLANSYSTGSVAAVNSTGDAYAGGIVAHCKDSSISNTYYLDTSADNGVKYDETDSVADGGVVSKVADDFMSGAVTMLLQDGQDTQDTIIWGQSLTGSSIDEYPIITSDGSLRVLRVDFYLVTDGVAADSPFDAAYANDGSILASYPEASGTGEVYVFYSDSACENEIDTSTHTYSYASSTNAVMNAYAEIDWELYDLPDQEYPDDDSYLHKIAIQVGVSEVPEELQAIEGLDTTEEIEATLTNILITSCGYPEENTIVYEVVLMVSEDGGKTWVEASAENFPTGGLTIVLPYPEGTNGDDYDFAATHMFTTTDFGKTPGDTENLTVTKTDEGIQMTVTGLSPIAIAWEEIRTASNTDPTDAPEENPVETGNTTNDADTNSVDDTSDSANTESADTTTTLNTVSTQTGDTNPVLPLAGTCAAALAVIAVLVVRRRKRA